METLKSEEEKQAYNRLAALCVRREYCRSDLKQKLRKMELTTTQRNHILDLLESERYFNEERYAKAFVHDKAQFDHWGRRKIRQALYMKEIAQGVVDEALKTEIDETAYRQTLRDLLRTKLRTLRFNPQDRRAAYIASQKLLRFAAARGFEVELIFEEIEQTDQQ